MSPWRLSTSVFSPCEMIQKWHQFLSSINCKLWSWRWEGPQHLTRTSFFILLSCRVSQLAGIKKAGTASRIWLLFQGSLQVCLTEVPCWLPQVESQLQRPWRFPWGAHDWLTSFPPAQLLFKHNALRPLIPSQHVTLFLQLSGPPFIFWKPPVAPNKALCEVWVVCG